MNTRKICGPDPESIPENGERLEKQDGLDKVNPNILAALMAACEKEADDELRVA